MSLFEFMIGSHKHLSHIVRYSTVPRVTDETVAEHSYFVAVYTDLLCRYAEENGICIKREKAISMALYHDMEESMSSDLPYNVKRSSKKLRDEFEKINQACMKQMLLPLPEELKQGMYSLWELSHFGKDDLEGHIVEFADRLSTVVYCAQEVILGNKAMIPIFNLIIEILEKELETFRKYCGENKTIWLSSLVQEITDYKNEICDPHWEPKDPYYVKLYGDI